MIVFRVLALILIALALMLLGADALNSLESRAVTLRETAELWAMIHAGSLDWVEGWIAGDAPAWAAVPIDFILKVPAWAVTGVLGVLFALLFGRGE
ncbi:MAG: hypothetical protein HXY25_10900 [Alphaproteobacteria bacterium]|nr:hypothetical protein [Alphaproteobacteria bacterium]